MKRVMTLLFAIVITLTLSMPAWPQNAQAKPAATKSAKDTKKADEKAKKDAAKAKKKAEREAKKNAKKKK